ncbi:MAG: GspH/FimT family pseudopilin [Gammaproteobacteria bacterium]
MKLRSNRGFTLVELMVTIAVFGILIAAAVPSLRGMIRNNQIATQANTFVAALQYARSEALKRRQAIVLKPTGGTADWAGGWTTWVDTDDDGSQDGGETVLKNQPKLSGGGTLTASNASNVVYRPNGFVTAGGCTADANFAFCADLCKEAGKSGRRIRITVTGRVELVSEYTCP